MLFSKDRFGIKQMSKVDMPLYQESNQFTLREKIFYQTLTQKFIPCIYLNSIYASTK